MSIRGVDTIIAVLADRTVTIEKATGELFSLALDSHVSTALALSVLFKTKPLARGARVLVLSSEFFTQTVRLPSLQTGGLSKEDLLAALVFEVEPFSNIPMAQGQAAFSAGEETAGIRLWNVLQIAKSEIQAIQSAIGAAGGKVVGLAFADSSRLSLLPDPELVARLREDAEAAEAGTPNVPVIRPATQGLGAKRQELIACLVFATVCCACLGHFIYAKTHLSALKTEVQKLENLAAANAQIESGNAAITAKIGTIEKARSDRENAEKSFARYRSAWRTLMRGLLDSCDNTVVIQKIEGDGSFEAEIGGLSTSEKGPGDFLAKLAKRTGDSGWRIQSESMQTVLSMGGQGPVRFTFHTSLGSAGAIRRAHSPIDSQDW
jgi:hypothetical protein